jgi:protein-disulfide isomerase
VQNKKTMTLTTLGFTGAIFLIIAACTNESAKAKPNYIFKEGTKAGILAKIGDLEIDEATLIGEAKSEFFDLEKRKHELRMERLEKIIEDKLVGAEAKKAGMSTEDYLSKKIVGNVKPSQSDYDKFVKEKKIPAEQLKAHPEYKDRIMGFLENQRKQTKIEEYVAKLSKSVPIEVYFKKPKMDPVKVDIGTAPIAGGKDAKVEVVLFSDFQCPFCARGAETLNKLKSKYGNKIKVAFKQFPLPMHPQAGPTSEAALCVNEQSTDKFWKFHDLAFKGQDKLDTAAVEGYAKSAGADVTKFKDCVAKGTYKEAVKADMAQGEKLGVRSTPTFFVNGQMVAGALPIEEFSTMIDEELNAKK